jgi:hypothetical protein
MLICHMEKFINPYEYRDVRLGFYISKMLDSIASEAPHFFQGEMVPWLYLRVRRSKAGGMHLMNCKKHKTGKDLKCPAARLTGPVRPVLSRPFISLEKMGASDAWRTNLIFMHKPNRTLLI